ncbi:efflux RND transporter periplasmic adaptor subunit [Methylobacterium flocculans]|uniref:efflux RND transporter periplasmic adaptor subunit n=1 Tax=Methylobacterium flocculans TaxID=2984843 RepID=UPI0021F2F245|nr:efflux RND transporter periplasmic adaptor subunit [Methylobacterium sp. FF17]
MTWRILVPAGLLVAGLLAAGLLALVATEQGARHLAEIRERLEPARTGPAHRPAPRVAAEEGRAVVRLSAPERARIGVTSEARPAAAHREELQAYGSVLDLARVTDLTNAYASAKAALQTAQARAEVSRSALQRARSLGPYATTVQREAAEGTFQTDQAALAAAESQVRTLSATAQQEWGPVIGRAIVERAPAITRLIERTDFLVQVTLPPGEGLKGPPAAAFAEVPPQSARVALAYVSPATRTDPRIQGLSFFYTVPGDSGFLPGMSMLAFLAADRSVTGLSVPEEAVVHWQGAAWIYRAVGPDTFARHRLRADPPISADSYVVEDLPGGTEIVLSGAQALLSEEMKGQNPASGAVDDD